LLAAPFIFHQWGHPGDSGDAAYNLPVSLACGDQGIYTCNGSTSDKYRPADYPENCGNPDATCLANDPGHIDDPNCVNAFFCPMFGMPDPNPACTLPNTLTIRYLSGE
jgi:hypothetical protein